MCEYCGQEHPDMLPTHWWEYSPELKRCVITNIPTKQMICKYFCRDQKSCDCNSGEYRESRPLESQKAIMEKYRPVFEKLAKT